MDQLQDPPPRRGKLLGGGEPIGRDTVAPARPAAGGRRDPDLEELVEVRREDGEEADALEEQVSFVLGLGQHPRIELQPRRLAGQGRPTTAPALSSTRRRGAEQVDGSRHHDPDRRRRASGAVWMSGVLSAGSRWRRTHWGRHPEACGRAVRYQQLVKGLSTGGWPGTAAWAVNDRLV